MFTPLRKQVAEPQPKIRIYFSRGPNHTWDNRYSCSNDNTDTHPKPTEKKDGSCLKRGLFNNSAGNEIH